MVTCDQRPRMRCRCSRKLVALHFGSDRLLVGGVSLGQLRRGDASLDAARHSRLTADQSTALERQHHLVHDRRGDQPIRARASTKGPRLMASVSARLSWRTRHFWSVSTAWPRDVLALSPYATKTSRSYRPYRYKLKASGRSSPKTPRSRSAIMSAPPPANERPTAGMVQRAS
jgi:hypothetical protein